MHILPYVDIDLELLWPWKSEECKKHDDKNLKHERNLNLENKLNYYSLLDQKTILAHHHHTRYSMLLHFYYIWLCYQPYFK